MFLQKRTMPYTADFLEQTKRLKEEIERADAIVIGAGSGLSTADGFAYAGPRFQENFADFIGKYHFADMYSAGFFPYDSQEEIWAYWSRHIYLNRYAQEPGKVYANLLKLMRDKNYFVLTTNVDHCFQRVGFDKARLFYTQGDYGLWQCSQPCHKQTYDNEEIVRRMVAEQKNMRVPTELVPHCPACGNPMTNNLRCDTRFVEDEGWHLASKRYETFLLRHQNGHVLFLELGVGGNTPVIIKYSFWQMTNRNPNAVYACVNQADATAPREIKERAICICDDIADLLNSIIS